MNQIIYGASKSTDVATNTATIPKEKVSQLLYVTLIYQQRKIKNLYITDNRFDEG